jgi:hypothetical protein
MGGCPKSARNGQISPRKGASTSAPARGESDPSLALCAGLRFAQFRTLRSDFGGHGDGVESRWCASISGRIPSVQVIDA